MTAADRTLAHRDAVDRHVALFNSAVSTGDAAELVANFTDDATMRFANVPIGPFHGRQQIAAAYAAQPPDDTMAVTAVDTLAADACRAAFRWSAGGTGTMTFLWRDGLVAELDVAFDPSDPAADRDE